MQPHHKINLKKWYLNHQRFHFVLHHVEPWHIKFVVLVFHDRNKESKNWTTQSSLFDRPVPLIYQVQSCRCLYDEVPNCSGTPLTLTFILFIFCKKIVNFVHLLLWIEPCPELRSPQITEFVLKPSAYAPSAFKIVMNFSPLSWQTAQILI
jgi:hypothetical protein